MIMIVINYISQVRNGNDERGLRSVVFKANFLSNFRPDWISDTRQQLGWEDMWSCIKPFIGSHLLSQSCYQLRNDSILFPYRVNGAIAGGEGVRAESLSIEEEFIHSGSVASFLDCCFKIQLSVCVSPSWEIIPTSIAFPLFQCLMQRWKLFGLVRMKKIQSACYT